MKNKINQLGKGPLTIVMIIMAFIGFLCIFPYIISIIISFTPADVIKADGYQLIPTAFDTSTYAFVLTGWKDILHAYFITIVVTLIGTILVLAVTMSCGYVLSRSTFKYKRALTIYIFITMLFNAGMTANYMIMTQTLHLNNTIWALILPLAVNPFWIFIARTFIKQTVPESIIESAQIDGASEIQTFMRIVLPVCKPVIATIGLFSTLAYWNDWFNAKLYITEKSLYTLQFYLVKMQDNIKFMKENAALLGAQSAELAQSLPDDTIVMAVMVIVTIPLALSYPYFQRYFVEGLTVGSVK